MCKRICMMLVLFSLLVVFSSCKCKPAVVGSLAVTLHPQETSMWCWAASGQMVMDYLGNNVAQCTQANNRFNRNDCCDIDLCPNPDNGHACATGGWPEFDKYGFTFKKTTNAPLSWDDLRKQISNEKYCKKKPFAFTWAWDGGGGHMMVAKGYLTLNNTNYVVMLDPWAPCVGDERIITYDDYDDGAGYSHWNDYYDVTPI